MKLSIFLALLCSFAAFGLSKSDRFSPNSSNPPYTPVTEDGLSVGAAITHKNLTIFPVFSAEALTADRFSVLDDGLENGKILILEKSRVKEYLAQSDEPESINGEQRPQSNPVQQESNLLQTLTQNSEQRIQSNALNNGLTIQSAGQGNDVNELFVINNTDKPLYLMPGQVLLGGDQDRMIAKETIIPNGSDPVPVAVFCVEHGRWGQREIAQTGGQLAALGGMGMGMGMGMGASMGAAEISEKVAESNKGKFVANAGNVSRGVRLAAQVEGGQGKVWEKVDSFNKSNKTDNATQSFTLNLTEKQAVEKQKPYLDAMFKPVADTRNVVGVVVAINGKVETVDVFESTPLFKKMWPRLMQGYALDAVSTAAKKKEATICDQKTAQQFLVKTIGAEATKSEKVGTVDIEHRENKEAICITSRYTSKQTNGESAGGGGFGGSVHSAGFSK